jgi:hypothetical protein
MVAENGRAKDILGVFDCRGIEIVSFEPGNSLSVITKSGVTFNNIDIRYSHTYVVIYGLNTTRKHRQTLPLIM